MSYRLLSKGVKALTLLIDSFRASLYFLLPKLWFRELGLYCQFKGLPRFGYAFREIYLGRRCTLGKGVFLHCGPNGSIQIGNRVGLNDYTYISALYGVTIGNNTRIGEFVSIRDNDHTFSRLDMPICHQGFTGTSIDIEDDVWIGRGVFVGKGVQIGQGAVIGANSVVTKDIPAYAVAVGSPAKVIKYRNRPLDKVLDKPLDKPLNQETAGELDRALNRTPIISSASTL